MVNSPLVRVAGKYIPHESIRQVEVNKDKQRIAYTIRNPITLQIETLYEEWPYGDHPSEYLIRRIRDINAVLREK